MNNRYLKKFSFGISLGIELKEYERLIEKYGKYISSVYFSLPYGNEFHTRTGVKEEYNKVDSKKRLIRILELFKKNGIKLEAVVNQYHINLEKVEEALSDLDSFITVDSVCCLDEYKEIIDKHYNNEMYTVSSFNNEPIHESIIDNIDCKYNMIVISKELMRKPNLIKKIKDKGIDVKLLVNNGCSFNCKGCRLGYRQCIAVFNSNLNYYTPEELYALQSFFPWELDFLFKCLQDDNVIDEIKISSRPCTYEYLDKCLQSYIYNKKTEKYIKENFKNYYLWGRQSNLTPYHAKFNNSRINEIKKKIWYREINNI